MKEWIKFILGLSLLLLRKNLAGRKLTESEKETNNGYFFLSELE